MTLISPDTFTTFTPLLPCKPLFDLQSNFVTIYLPTLYSIAAAVGTVSVRSLIESLRKIVARLHGQLIHARAVDLVMSERLVEVESEMPDGQKRNFYVPYAS